MKRAFLVATLAMAMAMPGVSFAAGPDFGNADVRIDADGTNGTIFGLGIGRDASGRPLRIQAPNGTFCINMENASGVNVFQLRTDANGNGIFTGRDSANAINVQFSSNTTGNSFIKTPFAVLTTPVAGKALTVNGTTQTKILEITGGSDLAEQFAVTNDAEPGSVVCIDANTPGALIASSKAYDRTVAGVVSGAGGLNVGMMMGQAGSLAHGDHPVALTGRVYVKATAANGAIAPGDMLTTSEVPGHAMKVTDYSQAHGAVIGKAMTALDSETGLVLVLISLQ